MSSLPLRPALLGAWTTTDVVARQCAEAGRPPPSGRCRRRRAATWRVGATRADRASRRTPAVRLSPMRCAIAPRRSLRGVPSRGSGSAVEGRVDLGGACSLGTRMSLPWNSRATATSWAAAGRRSARSAAARVPKMWLPDSMMTWVKPRVTASRCSRCHRLLPTKQRRRNRMVGREGEDVGGVAIHEVHGGDARKTLGGTGPRPPLACRVDRPDEEPTGGVGGAADAGFRDGPAAAGQHEIGDGFRQLPRDEPGAAHEHVGHDADPFPAEPVRAAASTTDAAPRPVAAIEALSIAH